MPNTVSINARRRGTIATPERIFAACRALSDEKESFGAKDVIAKNGGGSETTTNSLMRLWRHYKPVLDSIDGLNEASAVSLLQMLDKQFSELKADLLRECEASFVNAASELEQEDQLVNSLREQLAKVESQLEFEREKNSDLRLKEASQLSVIAEKEEIIKKLDHEKSEAMRALELAKLNHSEQSESQEAQSEANESPPRKAGELTFNKEKSNNSKREELYSISMQELKKGIEIQKQKISAQNANIERLEKDLNLKIACTNSLERKVESLLGELEVEKSRIKESEAVFKVFRADLLNYRNSVFVTPQSSEELVDKLLSMLETRKNN